jgi:tight adherence protein C
VKEIDNKQVNVVIERWGVKLLERLQAERRWPGMFTMIQLKLVMLEGPTTQSNAATRFVGRNLMYVLAAMLTVLLIGLTSGDEALLLAGLGAAALLPFFLLRQLDSRIRTKKRQILIELPELLSKLILLVNAGDTVQQAIGRCVAHPTDSAKSTVKDKGKASAKVSAKDVADEVAAMHPLDRELAVLARDMGNGLSFSIALEHFSKRCGVQEVTLFTNTVLLNYRRGGDDFVTSLRELNRVLWDKRKALAKTLGEEASSKLVFPMVLIFVVVMVVVATPAILLMSF